MHDTPTSRPSRRTRLGIAALSACLFGGLAVAPAVVNAEGDSGEAATYRVTVENIASGFQPLSPAGVAVHGRGVDVWSVGHPASAAVAAIAEDANGGIFADSYTQVDGVSHAFVGGGGPAGPGGSFSFEFEAERGDRLSLVTMLVNTNDAFTGLDGVKLGNGTRVYEVDAYDSGTEVNNELATHIPGPIGGNPFVRAPEGNVIAHHPGVQGGADLDPAVHGWEGPVARITIERIG